MEEKLIKIPCIDELIHKPESFFIKRYPDFHNEIKNKYHDGMSFYEKLYWYIYGITSYPLCPICGNHLHFISRTKGYTQTCSMKCNGKNPTSIAKRKNTNIKRYGVENPFAGESIKEKIRKSNLEKYGVEYPMQNADIRKKSENTFMEKYGVKHYLESDEGKNKILSKMDESIKKRTITNIERYGVSSAMCLSEIKDKKNATCMDRYGVDHYTMTDEYKKRSYLSKKEHHTFTTSSIENDFAEWLDNNNYKYIRQYRSDLYPFDCDFYFPDIDMYFEIQGNWTHGFHRFNPNSPDDQNILEKWRSKNTKYYNIAIKVWTESDPLKEKTAKQNNLNWGCVYSIDLKEVVRSFKEKYEIYSSKNQKEI